MSGALAGSLHTSSFADVLGWLVRDARTGVLRIRHAGPDGAARGEIVFAEGRLVGGAIYRAGGFKGTGDALVEEALCSPEDAQGALEYAAQTAQYTPGMLAEGAERAGVSIDRVEAALVAHLHWVLKTMGVWRAGSWEFLLEGLPATAEDRDSAAARAFLLDRGVDAASLDLAGGDLSKTLVQEAANVAREQQDPEVTRKSKAVKPATPAARLVSPPAMDTEPEFRMPEPTAATAESPAESATRESDVVRPDAVTGRIPFVEPPVDAPAESPAEAADAAPAEAADEAPAEAAAADEVPIAADGAPAFDDAPVAADDATPDEAASVAGDIAPADEAPPAEGGIAAAADLEPPQEWEEAPAFPQFDAPGTLPDEPTPLPPTDGPAPVFETPAGDLGGEEEPEPPIVSREDRIDVAAPVPTALGESELFADADNSDASAPEPDPLAAAEGEPVEFDEPTQADVEPAGDVDWAAPGGAEAALMEAETLLDSEVLSVMLEMGNSAAATASATLPGTERILTGHVLLVDEEGQMTSLALAVPMREAGYVVHIVRGLVPATEALDRASAEGARPLAIVDLLLKRGEGGMQGGLDLVSRAASLGIPAVLLGEDGGDVRAKALEAGVVAVLPRPLRSDLKDETIRKTFVASVLAAVDEHRPHPEWMTPVEIPEALDMGNGPSVEEGGWDVQEIAKKAEEVEDIPDFGVTDPAARQEALWRETIASLSGSLSRTEVLLQVLRFGAEVLTRAVIFTPNAKKELTGFGQFGIELAPGVDADDTVRHIRFPLDAHPAVAQAVEGRQPIRSSPGASEWEAHLTMSLGGIRPERVFFGPVFCQGRLAALLYGDMLPAKAALPDTTNLEILLGQAGLALDRAQLEARIAALERKE